MGPGTKAMRHTRHSVQSKPTSHPRPEHATSARPLGMQRLSRKTWDKVRAAIRAMQTAAPSNRS